MALSNYRVTYSFKSKNGQTTSGKTADVQVNQKALDDCHGNFENMSKIFSKLLEPYQPNVENLKATNWSKR